ncbi:MAG: hypothetical protein H6719_17325 [Sandaracinaceae bacterium]|nr:hypothetical protein [Sandaracinaceae bacterium]
MADRGDRGGPEAPARPLDPRWLAVAAVGLVAVGALLPALLPGAGYTWDDHLLIAEHPWVHAADGWRSLLTSPLWEVVPDRPGDYFRPLVSLTYWLEVQAFGDAPGISHAVNVALHVLCVALVARWLWRRVDATGLAPKAVALWLAGALVWFAVHPSRPETVAWIAGRTDLLALALGLLALEAAERRGVGWSATTAGLLGLALLCKETGVVFVGLLWTDALLLPRPEARTRRAHLERGVVTTLLAVATVARVAWLPPSDRALADGAIPVISTLGLYVRATLSPFPPSAVIEPLELDAHGAPVFAPVGILLGGLAIATLAALTVLALRRASARPWLADALWFLAPLVPVLQIVSLGLPGQVAERFLYIPMMGISALLLRAGLTWQRRREPPMTAVAALVLVNVAFFVPFTQAFAGAFRDDAALWGYELAIDPERAYVQERALHLVPAGDARGRLERARRLAEVAADHGQHAAVVRGALVAMETLAQSAPPDQCPEALLTASRRLGAGEAARLTPDWEVRLPAAEARAMAQSYPPYTALRAELMLRCGQAREAVQLLREGPPGETTQGLLPRALALSGDWDRARARMRALEEELPLSTVVRAEARRFAQADALHARAGSDPRLGPVWRSQAASTLGDFAAARRALAPTPALEREPVYFQNAIELERFTGHPDAATRLLARARAALPEHEETWRRLEATIPH